jgi:hypothetical protein
MAIPRKAKADVPYNKGEHDDAQPVEVTAPDPRDPGNPIDPNTGEYVGTSTDDDA